VAFLCTSGGWDRTSDTRLMKPQYKHEISRKLAVFPSTEGTFAYNSFGIGDPFGD
jgi:hypothetical protein